MVLILCGVNHPQRLQLKILGASQKKKSRALNQRRKRRRRRLSSPMKITGLDNFIVFMIL
jgi:hypothetical protein